jgi:hypothetical protein
VLAQQQSAIEPLTDEERRASVTVDTARPLDPAVLAGAIRSGAEAGW